VEYEAHVRTLSRDEARRVYDWIGAKQDTQAFYEDRATDQLLRHAQFDTAQRVFEFGCGTGRFALRLLSEHLPPTASYRGVDLSPTMVRLASRRLEPFAARASVTLTEGEPPVAEAPASCDRFVSNFVLDLLAEEDIRAVLREAHRILEPAGLLCLASLSQGSGAVSRIVGGIWSRVHAFRPSLVGGCRPLDLLGFLPASDWRIRHHARLAPFGLPSEAIVAEPC
jgi:ubiquinone/menaquinone biosynthesis C-methylase UbiE